eukprot:g5188.t1
MADTESTNNTEGIETSVDVLFLLICCALVLMMQPGFALYEVGTISRTPPEEILIKNIVDASVAFASWFAFGNMFAGDGRRFLGLDSGPFLTGDDFGEDGSSLAYMRFVFSATFAGTAVTILSGSVADRVPYGLYAIYAVWTCTFAYPVVVHWAWSQDGWLSPIVGGIENCGVLDFAGSGVVHCFAGTTSLIWAWQLGSRVDRFNRDESGLVQSVNFANGFDSQDRTQQALGVFLLWVGWYGFNCGSALSISSTISRDIMSIAAVNTTISPAVCCLTSMAIEWAYFKDSLGIRIFERSLGPRQEGGDDRERMDLHSAAINGILSGLVSITAGCATTDPHLTIAIAIVAAFVYHVSYRGQLHHGLDDAVNAVPVHLYCGLWGLLAAAFFFSEGRHDALMTAYGVESPGKCSRWGQIGANILFGLVVVGWSGLLSFFLFHALQKIPTVFTRPDTENVVQTDTEVPRQDVELIRRLRDAEERADADAGVSQRDAERIDADAGASVGKIYGRPTADGCAQ